MARRLTLAWGLHCVETEDAQSLDDVAERACQIAHMQGFAKLGDRVVITAGLPLGTPGATNFYASPMSRSSGDEFRFDRRQIAGAFSYDPR